MPMTQPRRKSKEGSWDLSRENYNQDKTWDEGVKMGESPGKLWSERPPNRAAHREQTGFKSQGMNWSDQTKKGQDFTRLAAQHCGTKQGKSRKAASAMIAKIPFPLSQWIAKTMKPKDFRK
jgi:hypothetical protein